MRDKTQNFIFYILVVLTGTLLTYWFNTVQDDILQVLLYPHARITELFHNIPMVYVKGMGYLSDEGTFAIGRECMGSKFMVIMFGMTACMFGKYFNGIKKAVWFIVSLIGALLVGILVSSVRIAGSVIFIHHPEFPLFHSGIGISLYLFALTASYVVLSKLLRSVYYEKSI
jgi:exosortase K